jgi:conjugative relaxase-like TrwC/TraI family protein
VVLRIHVVRGGGHAYYVDDLVPGRAEGTLLAGEEPGVWWGAGADAAGQHGRVAAGSFADLLDGRDPASGSPLRTTRADSVSGYDLTFGAPKSVSLLHLLAPREIAEESGESHRAAVEDALRYLERSAIGVRRVRSGELRLMPATGMAAGMFLHRTSRALDPHLHSHVVAANVALGVDGRWSSVDSRRLFAHAQAAQALYHARLRFEVDRRLGGAFEVGPSGVGDVLGVDRSMMRLFSQRAAAMAEYGHRRAGARGIGRRTRGAFHATRPGKDTSRTVDSLKAEWRERAATFGLDLGDLTAVVGLRHVSPDRPVVEVGRVDTALRGVADRGGSLYRRDLVAAVARSCTAGAPAEAVESVADHLAERTAGPSFPGARMHAVDVIRVLEGSGRDLEERMAAALGGLVPRVGLSTGDRDRSRSPRTDRSLVPRRPAPDLHVGRP